jgi:glutamate-1-semialdehyde 2,1-aminomutase
MGNVGLVLPDDGYLADVRRITEEHGVLLIFDEVITGYRIGIGGAQRLYGIRPDLTTFGKVIGGGLPIGAFAGRREIMQLVAPAGPVYQAGTYSGNPLSLAAGAAAISYLHAHPECYRQMEDQVRAIGDAVDGRGPGSFVQLGSCFTYFFRSAPPRDYREAKESDTAAFRAFWEGMLARGIFLPPSQFETCFLSAVHTLSDIERISTGFKTCL